MPKFDIVKVEDSPFPRYIRRQFRIRLEGTLSEDQLRQVCELIIHQEKRRQPHHALTFLFYLPDSNVDGFYTAGFAAWSPPEKGAHLVNLGDYSSHKLVIQVGNPFTKKHTSGGP